MHRHMNRLRDIMSNGLSRALVLSLLAHALIAGALLVTMPLPEPEPEPDEQVVEVTLVPPPEPEQPETEEPAAEEQAAARSEPEAAEEAAAEEPATEQPPAEPEAAEPPAPEPPAVEPEPEPAAPEPEPEPEPEAEQPAPEPEQSAAPQDQAGADQPGADEPGEGEATPIPVLRPVFQFGEEDSGPRKALDGDSSIESGQPDPSEGEAAPDQAEPDETQPTEQEQATAASEEAAAEAEALPPEASLSETPDQPTPDPATPDQPVTETPGIALPEITLPDAQLSARPLSDADPTAAPPVASDLPGVNLAPPPVAAEATTPVDTPGTGLPQGDLAEAGNLFSPDLTENRVAMTAMGSLPRKLRASQLCTTELREQLRNGATSYGVELLPSYQLDSGTILAVPDAAFRADGDWYNLSFRCTVDADALKVVSFALKVGTAIPRDEWKARGFPEF